MERKQGAQARLYGFTRILYTKEHAGFVMPGIRTQRYMNFVRRGNTRKGRFMNESTLEQLPGSPGCVICDNNGSNPRSLALKILWNAAEGTVHIPCVPDETWCGYSSIVHGGLVASVMDEAMAWVVKQVSGDWAFTADYHVRYKAALEPGREYTAIAEVSELGSRRILALARFVGPDGRIAAQAEAVFLPSKGRAMPRQGGS